MKKKLFNDQKNEKIVRLVIISVCEVINEKNGKTKTTLIKMKSFNKEKLIGNEKNSCWK